MSTKSNGHEEMASHPLPYGERQGSFMGVIASSNRDDGFFSGESNYVQHVVYTGYRYQCVEYARRFLLLTTGCVFSSCGRASEIFDKKTLTHVETGETFDFIAHPNGTSARRPAPGDIIVYPYHAELLPWGHVAVISYVDNEKVGIAEQNQTFFRFFSPDPNYLAGECCVNRFVDLEMTEDGHWRLKERERDIVDCLGWMSYPTAPQREVIHQPLKVLPEHQSVRATPVGSEKHPCLWRFQLPVGTCQLSSLYLFRYGTGESLIGAVTSFSRIVRDTLTFLFTPRHLSAGFAALPTNPLGAKLSDVRKELNDIMEAVASHGDNEELVDPVIATYFDLPLEVITAMRREILPIATHMIAKIGFCFNVAADGEKQFPSGVKAHVLKSAELHDEAWLIENTSFGNPVFFRDLTLLRAANESCQEFIEKALSPGAHFFLSHDCCADFSRYVKYVEKIRGSRTGFTIIKNSSSSSSTSTTGGVTGGDDAEIIVTTLLLYCEAFHYPTYVFDESQAEYDVEHSKLYGTTATGSKVHIDFCFCLAEWRDILSATAGPVDGELKGCSALRQAAVDPRSDVIFAKPLWSHLCSGRVHHHGGEETTDLGPKFFDISRRLYEFASPKQPPEKWEHDVDDYKGSCRRCHLATPPVAEVLSGGVRAEAVMVNFASSSVVGRETNGEVTGLMHMFS